MNGPTAPRPARLVPATLPVLAFVVALAAATPPVRAETWATCTGTIDALPATISQQGVWCLGQDLATGIGSGVAITITTNNVTIDCNGFKIGNLSAGPTTAAIGIRASARRNVVVRGCNVRGFATAIELTGSVATSSGHVVEDNLVEGSTTYGIVVNGADGLIRRNRLIDIGPNAAVSPAAIAAIGTVDVLDNLVDGVMGQSVQTAWGIYASPASGIVVARNHVRSVSSESGIPWGIYLSTSGSAVSSLNANVVIANAPGMRWIGCSGYPGARRRGNVLMGDPPYVASDCWPLDDIIDP